MAFTITAELPLGTYRGARADGGPESVPSVARLYSALLCAAGFGPRAVPCADDSARPWGPCDDDEAALRWLEENPPDAVSVPAIEVNTGSATAYRDDGTIKSVKGTATTKKFPKSPDVSVAVDGAFRWTWSRTPPPHVVIALEALCPDVPHLGTTESPVRLITGADEGAPTHVLDPDAGLFAGAGGEDVEVPTPGRLAELQAAHDAAYGRVPLPRQDRIGSDEWSRSPAPPRAALALARYAPLAAPRLDVPWPDVMVLPLEHVVPERDRVGLAVAAHRALIAAIGDGAPPLITGVYPDGTARPANRLAIQVLDADMPVDLAGAPAALALLVPQGAASADLEALTAAARALRSIRGRGGRTSRVTGPERVLSGASFWRSPASGVLRWWRTTPPAVPDTRGVQNRPWTFAHAALLSVGYVWRQQLGPVPGRGDERQLAVVEAVNAAGAAVLRAAPVRQSDVRPWVHKVHPHAVVRPYRADLWLGDLAPARAVQAIGQTRHLGGGLLVPHDVPTRERDPEWD